MGTWGPGSGMLVVETIAKIRRAFFVQKKPIKTICRELRVSRKVVRKVIRSQATEFRWSMHTSQLGTTDKDCPFLWILSASRVAAYPTRQARRCKKVLG